MSRLSGPWAKLERAEEQLKMLDHELDVALDPADNPLVVNVKADPYKVPGAAHYTFFFSDVPTMDRNIGLRIGEITHNFRSALDYAAWILVRRRGRNPLTEKEARQIQFPLARTQKDFWNRPNRLLGVPRKPYWTFIESYQPYHRTDIGVAMRRLRRLTDVDKHRLLLPTLSVPRKGQFTMDYKGGTYVDSARVIDPRRAIQKGTEIGWLLLSGDPSQHIVHMKGHVVYVPVFPMSVLAPIGDAGPANIVDVLEAIRATCRNALDGIEEHL